MEGDVPCYAANGIAIAFNIHAKRLITRAHRHIVKQEVLGTNTIHVRDAIIFV